MEVAYLLVNCLRGKFKIAATALRRFDEIDELHEVYGRFDIIAKVICENKHELKAFVQNKLQIAEGVKYAETLIGSDIESD